MKKIYSLLMTMALAVGLTSCGDNWSPNSNPSEGEGQVSFASLDVDVSDAENVVSRDGSTVDLSNFIITIESEAGEEVAHWTYINMPEVFTLPVGKYTVKVVSHEVKPAEFGKPLYVGTQDFEIRMNEITEIESVICKLASIRVTVQYSDALRAKLTSDCKVTVIANNVGQLVFTPDMDAAVSGYFAAVEGSTTLIAEFSGTLKGESTPVKAYKEYTDAKGGNHYLITFKLKDNNNDMPDEYGDVVLGDGVTLSGSITDVTVGGNVDAEDGTLNSDDRPGKEENDEPDPGPGPNPPATTGEITMTCPELTFEGNNPMNEGMDGRVFIHSVNPIANLKVNITSDNADFISAVTDMLGTSFDLCYPGAIESNLRDDLGFPVGNDIIGKNDVVFDITQFIPILAAFDGPHHFALTVVDNTGYTVTKTLTFK